MPRRPLLLLLILPVLLAVLRTAPPAAAQDAQANSTYYLPAIMHNPLPPDAPVLQPVTGAEDGTFTLTWSKPAGRVNEFIVHEARNAAFTQDVIEACSTSTTSCEITDRRSGVYFYRVLAANEAGQSPWSNVRQVVVPFPTQPAISLSGFTDYDRNYVISWSVSTHAIVYRLQVSQNSAFTNPENIYIGPDRSISINNQPDGVYYYRVRGESRAGVSPWSSLISVPVVRPAAPVLNRIDNSDFDRAYTVSWNATSRATTYTLQQSTNANFTGATTVFNGPGTSWTINPQARGLYYYRVRASNPIGASGWSAVQTVRVDVPSTPALDPIENNNFDRAYTVTWSAADRAISYELAQSSSPNFAGQVIVFAGTGRSWSINPQARGTYYYRVRAVNPVGPGSWSSPRSITIDIPTAPVLQTISNPDSDGSYTVTWSEAARATTYRLEESDSSTFASPRVVFTGNQRTWATFNRANGVYYYRVRAENPIGAGPWSNIQSVRVGLIAPVLQPIENADNNNFYRLNWNAVPSATGYVVEEANNSSFTNARVVYEGGNTTWLAFDRPTFGAYFYRVRATRSGAQGAWSNVRSVNIPLPPSGVTVLNNHGAYKPFSGSAFMRVAGEIYNNTTTPVTSVRVTVRFYRGSSVIATDTENIWIDIVHPGEKAPFLIIMADPGSYDRYDFAPVSYSFTSERRPNLSIHDVNIYMQFDDLQITGDIRNDDSVTARQVSAHFVLFDETGKILDTPSATSISTSSNILSPGQTATFNASSAYPDFSRLVYIRYHTDGRKQ